MAHVLETPSRSLKEFRLLPGRTPATPPQLGSRLCRQGEGWLALGAPIVGAAMQAVTGEDMAVALAQLGGIGVLPVSQPIEAQCRAVESVHRYKAGFQTGLRTLAPDQSLAEVVSLMQATGYTRYPVTDTGIFHGRLVGVLTDKDFDPQRDLECRVIDRMRKDLQVGIEVEDLEAANQLMVRHGRGWLPIVSEEGTLLSVVFKKDRDKHLRHPDETVDRNRRLRVAAAVSTHPEDRERAAALLEAGVDALLIDASDGHTDFQAEMLEWLKERAGAVPVIAGNVVTADGFDFLAERGADAVKVGLGIGSGCITQEVRASGRGQASALLDVAAARGRHAERTGCALPVIADGGISGAADIAIALALGADCVMLGNLLARYTESPGRVVDGERGETWKEYWMEGSRRAHNQRRYAQTRSHFFEEGVEGWVPHAGSVYDGLPRLLSMLRAALATAGAVDIATLQRDALLELQSGASLRDAAVHAVRPLESGTLRM